MWSCQPRQENVCLSAWAQLQEAGAGGYLLTPGLGLGPGLGQEVQRCEIHCHGSLLICHANYLVCKLNGL